MMKKSRIIAFVCTLVMMISLFTVTADAARVGDVIGYAQPTDIVATINGYQLESYNVNGYTYICVEDLRYYGFDVYYDNSSRTLSVNRNWGITSIDPQNTNPKFWEIGSSNTKKKILYTDIKTYVNNSYVASSNINGKTIIQFDHLKAFGAVSYDNSRREISLTMDYMYYNPVVKAALVYEEYLKEDAAEYDWTTRVRAKGNMIMLTHKSTNINYSDANNTSSFAKRIKSGDLHEGYEADLADLRSLGYNISSLYVEYFSKDGKLIASTQIY